MIADVLHSCGVATGAVCVGLGLQAAVIVYVGSRIRHHRRRAGEAAVLSRVEAWIAQVAPPAIVRPRPKVRTPRRAVPLAPGWRLTADGDRIFVGSRA